MICIFAEKFDVGIKIVAALGDFSFHGTKITSNNIEKYKAKLEKEIKPNGYVDITYNGRDYAVTWASGHLCSLKQAKDYNPDYLKWSNIPVPFFPERYEIKVKEQIDMKTHRPTGKPDPWTCRQLKIVKKLFQECDYIINATDDDREGELIFAYVYQILGVKKPYKRVIFDSQTQEGYIKAFSNLKDSSDVKNVEYAGRARAIADWVVGANLSVLMSLKYGGFGKDSLISIGRVQTPTLNLLVQRELEIRNFKSHPFWYITATFKNKDGEKYSAKHEISQIENKKDVETLFNKINGKPGTVVKYDKTKKTKDVPMLYNLANLSIDSNRKYGISANNTLAIVQELYMAGFVSYPRTESTCLTDDMKDVVDETIDMLSELPEYKKYISAVNKKDRNYTNRHFNSKKVESHFAIIPTNKKPEGLSEDQKKVYDLIAKSLIRIIYKPAVLEDTKIITEVEGEKFKSSGTVVKDPQWLAVDALTNENFLPNLSVGEIVNGAYEIKEGKTEPPSRYTDASLMAAMATAGKNIKDKDLRQVLEETNNGGIGRGSTRSAIIETVVTRYATRKGKSIIPSEKAIKLIEILPVDELKSATLTAEWEQRLDKIAKGEDTLTAFTKDMETETSKWCAKIKADNSGTKLVSESSNNELLSINCPVCGKPMKKLPWGWSCSAYNKEDENSCKFAVGYSIAGAKLSDRDISDLLLNKRTKLINNFKSKSGKTFSAFLLLSDENKIQFSFNSENTCPKCNSPIEVNKSFWKCSNKSCDFILWNSVAGKNLSDKDRDALLNNKQTRLIKGFKSKAGKSFDAYLSLDENYKIKFVFPKK